MIEYLKAKDIFEKLKERAMIFLVKHPYMNVADRNFFEEVAIMDQIFDMECYVCPGDIHDARERIREEVKRRREQRE